MVGSIGVCGGATTVFCCELLTMTRPMTRPRTISSAMAAKIHSQRRELGPPGFGGSGGGWFGGPCCPVAYGLYPYGEYAGSCSVGLGSAGGWYADEYGACWPYGEPGKAG